MGGSRRARAVVDEPQTSGSTSDDWFDMYRDLFERARSLCRLSIDVLHRLGFFRQYVTDGMAAGGRMRGFNDSPQSLREAIYRLWSQCYEKNVPVGQDVWSLLPIVELANADHLRTIDCVEDGFCVSTATDAIFRWAESLADEALRACEWLPSGAKLASSEHDPHWAGTVQSIAVLEPYQEILRSIRKRLVQWKITEKNLQRLESWIQQEQVRTERYLWDAEAVASDSPAIVLNRVATTPLANEPPLPTANGDDDTTLETIIQTLKSPMETIIRAMGRAGITNINVKKSAQRIAHLPGSTRNYNSHLRNALKALRSDSLRLLDPPKGHGYFLNSLGVAVYERLKKSQVRK